MTRLPTFFLTHGGGPWPYMGGEYGQAFAKLGQSLSELPTRLPAQPKAILVVSGHWEAQAFTVSSAAHPGMLYDYYGFPEHTYQVQYPAPGEPQLATEVASRLNAAGLPVATDPDRGFDHGTFCLMQMMYPAADIPVVQISLQQQFDPEQHIQLGRLLAPLRDQGVLIVGSGSSYHNLRHFNRSGAAASAMFDEWLQATLVDGPVIHRQRRLQQWQQAPAALAAHPRAEHLLPLMPIVGAAENDFGQCIYRQTDLMGGLTVSAYQFG